MDDEAIDKNYPLGMHGFVSSNQAAQLMINPVQSARVRTTGTFTFKYGRMEVSKRMGVCFFGYDDL